MSYLLAFIFIALSVWSVFIIKIILRNILEMPAIALDLSALIKKEPEKYDTEKLSLKTDDDRVLSALKVTGRDVVPDKWILFLPEMAGSSATWEKYLHFLPQNGWGILALDFPGTGESTPYPSHKVQKFLTNIELTDAEIALNKTIELSEGHEAVPIFGVSRGSVAALTLASKHKSVGMVIADSPFSSAEVIKANFRRIAKIYAPKAVIEAIPDFFIHTYVLLAFSIAGILKKCRFIQLSSIITKGIDCPVLFINGKKDKLATVIQVEKLLKKSRRGKKEWDHLEVKGAKHNGSVLAAPELYKNKVIEFLTS